MTAQYLTVEEVSSYLKLPEETVYKYARTGRIPASKVGRYWRFERSLVDQWVASRSNQTPSGKRVFLADDDPAIRGLFGEWLRGAGCEVQTYADGNELIQGLKAGECDLLFLDLLMPTSNGVETLRRLRELRPGLPVVIITAHFDSQLMDDALAYGPLTVLRKPLDKEALLAAALGEQAVSRP